jgi:hypothetical protein
MFNLNDSNLTCYFLYIKVLNIVFYLEIYQEDFFVLLCSAVAALEDKTVCLFKLKLQF